MRGNARRRGLQRMVLYGFCALGLSNGLYQLVADAQPGAIKVPCPDMGAVVGGPALRWLHASVVAHSGTSAPSPHSTSVQSVLCESKWCS